MDCSMPGLPVHHQFPEFTQTHGHWVGNTIQPSHPLSSPSPAFNLSQHQGLFQWVSSSQQVAKVLEFQLQPPVLPMNTQDWSPLGWTGWITLQSKGLSRVFSNTTVQKHQFFGARLFFYLELMKKETDRTGSILKAGLHLGLDRGLWAICPVSMETTYQLENQTTPTQPKRIP